MLLGDGSHLSLAGHKVVAEVLYPQLKNLVENRAWFVKEPPLVDKKNAAEDFAPPRNKTGI
jgi:hypothetical protein